MRHTAHGAESSAACCASPITAEMAIEQASGGACTLTANPPGRQRGEAHADHHKISLRREHGRRLLWRLGRSNPHPNLLRVPGVHAVTRLKGEPFAVSIGGAEQQIAHTGPRYSALYEIEGPHVLVSDAWAEAVELGRWPSQVRPFTRNRRHTLSQIC